MTTLSTAALVVVAGALVWIALSGAALDLLARMGTPPLARR